MPDRVDPADTLRRAAALHRAGRLDEAAALYDSVLREAPAQADALHARGVLHALRGEFPPAVALIERALAARPDHPPALFDLGAALMGAGRFADALARFDRLAVLAPGAPDIAYNRGLALQALRRPEDALADFDRALAARPNDVEALGSRGAALISLYRFAIALATFERALALQPRSIECLNGAGVALRAMGRLGEAIARFDQVLVLRPGFTDALWNRAGALMGAGRCEEALRDYRQVAALDPSLSAPFAAVNRSDPTSQVVLVMRKMCAWSELAPLEERVVDTVRAGKPNHPATLLIIRDDPGLQRASADCWMRAKVPARTPTPRARADGDRIRLGYLSGEMREHALMWLMAGLFEDHDRAQFTVNAYSYGPDDRSALRHRLEAAFDRFTDVRGMGDDAIARRIAADGIDVLIDLSGHSEGSRIDILSRRPASVTVHCLGYPGTLGAGAVDWLIADPFVAAAEKDGAFVEALAILPDCYQVNDRKRAIAEATPSREACGLPPDGFVFCCFNNNFKITPSFFTVWMRVLVAVPGSVLWLLGDNRWAEENLRREAEARGVAGTRLVFAPRVPLADHLARHRLADLFLDTLPYGAHTTASDALWTGLPVLTCAGRSFAARVCGSLLTAIGLPELITTSLDEYEAQALALARDPARLAALKARLAARRDAAPLFDTTRYRKHIEHAYATMLERHERGEAPTTFAVPALD